MLKNGGMGTLIFDVRHKRGQKIEFLGQLAPTALSAAELAIWFDSLLVPIFVRAALMVSAAKSASNRRLPIPIL
ncbi:MAG: hypothetical protein ACU0C9_01915 [Paracoccaceae bacterium]